METAFTVEPSPIRAGCGLVHQPYHPLGGGAAVDAAPGVGQQAPKAGGQQEAGQGVLAASSSYITQFVAFVLTT